MGEDDTLSESMFILQRELSAHWGNQQNIHPLGLCMFLLAVCGVFFLRRQYAFLPILMILMMVSTVQRIVVGGLDFPFLRMLIMFGMLRVAMRNEMRGFRVMTLDKLVIAWALVHYVMEGVRDSMWLYGLGWTIDNLGGYFLCRLLVRSREDLYQFAKWAAILTIPVALLFVFEKRTQINLFSIFGGVSGHTLVRDGKIRAMGCFQHPILAGSYFAGLLPLLAVLWTGLPGRKAVRSRNLAAAGLFGMVTICVCCASSTPLVAMAAGIAAMALFKIRKSVPAIRWGTVFVLFCLHMVMQKPVWHLISRIDLAGGSTGYHRYRLIDATINHFHEWWAIGISYTWHWGHFLYDITGHFVLQCTEGGLLTFLLFVAIVTVAFRSVRRVIKYSNDKRDHWFVWLLGCCLYAHCIAFIGVSYFGKPLFLFYFGIAALCSLEMVTRDEMRRRNAQAAAMQRAWLAQVVARGARPPEPAATPVQ